MSEGAVMGIFRQIVQGVSDIHSRGIIHCDLKLMNIVCETEMNGQLLIKITDFGHALKTDTPDEFIMPPATGTPGWQAPEILTNQLCSSKVDVWSIGCCLYTLLFAQIPFPGRDEHQIKSGVITRDVEFEGRTISEHCEALLTKMLEKDPKDRYSIDEVMMHPWVGLKQNVVKIMKEALRDDLIPSAMEE